MTNATKIGKWVREYLDNKELVYERTSQHSIKLYIPLGSKIKYDIIGIDCWDDRFNVHTAPLLYADEDCRLAIAEYITRANFPAKFGIYKMDFSNGDLRLDYTHDCASKTSLAGDVLLKIIGAIVYKCHADGDALFAVMRGEKSPKEAREDASARSSMLGLSTKSPEEMIKYAYTTSADDAEDAEDDS